MVQMVVGNENHVDGIQFDTEGLHILLQRRRRTTTRVLAYVLEDTMLIGFHQVGNTHLGDQAQGGGVIFEQRENSQGFRCAYIPQ